MKKRNAFVKSVLLVACLLSGVAFLSSAGAAEEASGSWLDAWRDAVGLEVGDPTPVFGEAEADEKEASSDEERPRKRFVSPAASDAGATGEADRVTNADAGTAVDRLDPDASPLDALIGEWLRIAEPPINATDGAAAYYDEYGRMLGRLVGAVARADRKPDDVGGRTSREYVWSLRDRLDSVDHCTLGEYVARKIEDRSTGDCRGRYKPVVRDVVGMNRRTARIKLSGMGLNAVVLRKRTRSTQASSTPEDDMIVESTDPPAGTTVERNSTVYIVLRESSPDTIAKADPPSPADINPFDGGDTSWIDAARGREGRRSERNAARSQTDAASSGAGDSGSGGKPGFTSDGLLDDLEKMTGRRPDTGGASATATQTNASGGNESSAGPESSPAPEPGGAAQPPASPPGPEPGKPAPAKVSTPDPAPQKPASTPSPSPTPVPRRPTPTPVPSPTPVPGKPTPTPVPTPVPQKPAPTPTPTPVPTPPPPPPKERIITWNAPTLCEQNEGVEYRWRWMVSLKQSGTRVTGDIYFHKCPGGGRLSYRLTGEEQRDGSFVMKGTKSGGRGGLYGSSPSQSTFTLREGRPPSPSY